MRQWQDPPVDVLYADQPFLAPAWGVYSSGLNLHVAVTVTV
jgi:hypothetical protein